MATGTIAAELAAVHVITAVTAAAIARHRPSLARRAGMTGDTIEVGVSTIEREVGLGVVIERPDAPVVGSVADRRTFHPDVPCARHRRGDNPRIARAYPRSACQRGRTRRTSSHAGRPVGIPSGHDRSARCPASSFRCGRPRSPYREIPCAGHSHGGRKRRSSRVSRPWPRPCGRRRRSNRRGRRSARIWFSWRDRTSVSLQAFVVWQSLHSGPLRPWCVSSLRWQATHSLPAVFLKSLPV